LLGIVSCSWVAWKSGCNRACRGGHKRWWGRHL